VHAKPRWIVGGLHSAAKVRREQSSQKIKERRKAGPCISWRQRSSALPRFSHSAIAMSAIGTFRTSHAHCRMSAFGSKADMTPTGGYVG
jgi:hypothetical protein